VTMMMMIFIIILSHTTTTAAAASTTTPCCYLEGPTTPKASSWFWRAFLVHSQLVSWAHTAGELFTPSPL